MQEVRSLSKLQEQLLIAAMRCVNIGGLVVYSTRTFAPEENEFVVDNITNPKLVYGIANGKGDFIRNLSPNQIKRLKNMEEFILKN